MADTTKELRRLQEIISVLAQYGFQEAVEQGIRRKWLPVPPRMWRKPVINKNQASEDGISALSTPYKLRKVLEQLGGIFAKFGQVLSTRRDILPPEYIEALSSLRSQMPSCEYSTIYEAFINELGAPPEALFDFFSPEPLAAASLAQVHKARLHDGTWVAVKIQRPRVDENVAIDLKWLERLGELVINLFPALQPFRVLETIAEFKESSLRELNFFIEGRHIERFSENAERLHFLRIPQVHWRYTSKRVLTMDLMEGTSVDYLPELRAAGHDLYKIAGDVYYMLLKQTLIDGYFHGDLHPGNLLISPEGKLMLLDFGLVGEMSLDFRMAYFRYWTHLAMGNYREAVEALLQGADTSDCTDLEGFKQEYIEFCESVRGSSISEYSFGSTLNFVTTLCSRYRIYFSTEFILLIRAMLTAEGIIMGLNPDFAFVEEAYPFFRRYYKEISGRPRRSNPGAMLYEMGMGMGLWK
ncbi:MAG: ABC1 kinase family protein [Candidatus Sericytochromatia bacterium]